MPEALHRSLDTMDRRRVAALVHDELREEARAVLASIVDSGWGGPTCVMELAPAASSLDDVESPNQTTGNPFEFRRDVAFANRLHVIAAMGAAALGLRNRVDKGFGRELRPRLRGLATAFGIDEATRLVARSLARPRFLLWGRDSLRLWSNNLLLRLREIVFHLVHPLRQQVELRALFRELLLELRRPGSPSAVVSRRAQRSGLIMP